jgi:ribosome-associated protein YbcJ (S4-like RNA binding protein)
MQDNPASKAPAPSPSSAGRSRSLALRFISGKYQGGEFPLLPGKETVIGRSGDLDMVLAEDMVSRRHARIVFQGDQIVIEDMASTNGTFVNGEKTKRAQLREGDRVLIGTSILKVVFSEKTARTTEEQARRDMEIVASHRRTSQVRSMSGSIEEIPLPDLMQLLGTSKKNGVLVVRTEEDIGRVFLRRGDIYYATINDLDDIPPLKAIFRMLTWQHGLFDLDPPDEREFPNAVNVSVQAALMEGMRQLDEINRIKDQLPNLRARLRLNLPLVSPLRSLSPEELDVVQLVHNHGYFEVVLTKSVESDLSTARTILKLIASDYVRVE